MSNPTHATLSPPRVAYALELLARAAQGLLAIVAVVFAYVLATTPYSPTYWHATTRAVVVCAALVVVVEYVAARPLRRWSA